MVKPKNLLDAVAKLYSNVDELSNGSLYNELPNVLPFNVNEISVDKKINIAKRRIRWQQQTLKELGILERVPEKKGVWRLTATGKKKYPTLTEINSGHVLLAFSTKFGLALWADCRSVFANIHEPIKLCLSSPPYPLNNPKAYGNCSEKDYVDWICTCIEPIVKNLTDGGSIVLVVGNDCFIRGIPARSTYRERMVIAFEDRFGLYKMDEIPWVNLSKPPGPMIWASKTRQQLNNGWEAIYWFTNNPLQCDSNNNRVLEPHNQKHLDWLKSNRSEDELRSNSDGDHRVHERSYVNITDGKIPRNVIIRGHKCKSKSLYTRYCSDKKLPVHGATMPVDIANFFIKFLTKINELVVDPFAGSLSTMEAAEALERRCISTEVMYEYLLGSMGRFHNALANETFIKALNY